MSGETSGLVWTFGSLAVTALLIWAVATPLSVIMKARTTEGREERYRALALACLEGQQGVERRLAEIAVELAATRTHLAEVQRVLADVE